MKVQCRSIRRDTNYSEVIFETVCLVNNVFQTFKNSIRINVEDDTKFTVGDWYNISVDRSEDQTDDIKNMYNRNKEKTNA